MKSHSIVPSGRPLRSAAAAGAALAALALAPGLLHAQDVTRPVPPAPIATEVPRLAPPAQLQPPAPALRAEDGGAAAVIPATPVEPMTPASPRPPADPQGAEALSFRPTAAQPSLAVPDTAPTLPPARRGGQLPERTIAAPEAPAAAPPGATLRCRNGEYVVGSTDPGSCGDRGGVAFAIPQPPPPPPPAQP
jgi:hypothetical protein